jgi:glucose/arabinose dehydrogenase
MRYGYLGVMLAAGAVSSEAQQTTPPRALPSVPPGFSVTVFAEGLATPRHIAVRDNGDVYVTLRSGQAKFRPTDEPGGIAALRDTNGDGVADVQTLFGSADIDTGLAIHANHLYYASTTTIYAVALGDELVPRAAPEVVVADLPESGNGHRTKPITFDRAGNLYTQVGSPSNSCQAEPGKPGSPGLVPCTLLEEHGGVFRFSASARNQNHARAGVRLSTGQRNVVALEWNDAAGAPYLLMHCRDNLSQLWPQSFSAADDAALPAEEFHRLNEGDDLGWPYTYYDPVRRERMVSPEYGGDGRTPAPAGKYKDPLIGFPGHWAPNDLVFYGASQFPARFQSGAFIAFHGSVAPQGENPGGYSVAFVPMNAAGEVTGAWEIFADDFERVPNGAGVVARPSGLAVGPDGALYIGDDAGGRIFKVTYTGR